MPKTQMAVTEKSLHMCDDCGEIMAEHRLREVLRLAERVDPGHLVPSGECPKCFALCYPLEPHGDMKRIQIIADIALEMIKCPKNADTSKVHGVREAIRQIKRIVESDEA